ncbi:hypothetical protein [Cupriavidus sp. TMH.W2]|uniref:hypothetical protein n=1 Tax=Cupriavidus sp. TMH.W2 TaxID=3434465 RepID=UPI003D771679
MEMNQNESAQAKNLELELITPVVKGNLKNGMKESGASSGDLWAIDPFKIIVDEKYNVRERDDAYEAKVINLMESMLDPNVGFMRDSPLSVIVVKQNGADVIVLKRGHRRLEAAKRAIEKGASFKVVYAVATQTNLAEEDRIADLHHSNNGDKLSTYELSKVCKLLSLYLPDTAAIGKKLAIEKSYAEDLLLLIEGPFAIREHVRTGRITATFAIDMLKEHGEKAADMIQQAIDRAKASGSTKASAKHVPGAKLKKAVSKAAPQMRVVINDIKADPAFRHLSQETQSKIDAIFVALKQAEADEENLNATTSASGSTTSSEAETETSNASTQEAIAV